MYLKNVPSLTVNLLADSLHLLHLLFTTYCTLTSYTSIIKLNKTTAFRSERNYFKTKCPKIKYVPTRHKHVEVETRFLSLIRRERVGITCS